MVNSLKELGLPPIWAEVKRYYKLEKILGEGSYGTVIGGKCRVSN
jgi:hypothetical protein